MHSPDLFPLKRALAPCAAILLVLALERPAGAQVGTWATKAPMPTGRCCLVVAGANGNLYAVGGEVPEHVGPNVVYSIVEAYNPNTRTWVAKAPMPTARYTAGAGTVDGVIYIVGGANSSNAPTGAVEAYDPKTDKWTSSAPMPTPRSGVAVASVDGALYAIGGVQIGFINAAYATVEAFNPGTNSWTARAPMPTARYYVSAGVIDGLIYVVGGEKVLGPSVSETLPTLEVYDAKTNAWSTRMPMPVAVRGAAAGVIAGKLYVVGGSLNDDTIETMQNIVQLYDPQTGAWTAGPPIPTTRVFAGAGVVEDTLYVVGGYPALAVNEAFSPFLTVAIDIKPGDPNPVINLKSGGVVPVAILGSASFDATTVDPTTVKLAGAPVALRGNGKPMASVADVNGDGFPDLLIYFRTQKLQLTPADTEAVLYGKTYSGQAIRGSDKVKVIAPGRLTLLPGPLR